ncbi:MAG: sensor histidine kinase, partial [Cyclobacteriaceae bacterium]|nr:sensor histidine kinase [Cyclobacteriaceae bacterium]
MDEDKLLDFCHVLVDTSDMLTINDLLKMDSERFTTARQIGKELNPKFKYWATINISNSDSIVSYWLIELCLADYIELYQFDQNGKQVISKKAGELIPQSEHDFIDLLYSFRIKIPSNTSVKLFFKFWNDNSYPVFLSPHIRPEVEMYRWLYERNLKEFAIQGLFFGALIIMMLYNFLIFLTTREKTYGFYSLYILAITLFLMYKYYYLYMFITGSRFVDKAVWIISINIPIIFYLMFVMHFLNQQGVVRKWIRMYAYLKTFLVVIFIGILIISYDIKLLNQITNIVLVIELLLIVPPILYKSRQNGVLEKYIIAGTSTLYLFAFINLGFWLLNIRILFGFEIFYLTEIGIISQIFFFSYGLAKRVQIIEEGKRQAEKNLVESLKRTDKLKDEFLANTSHELRTPLQGIIGLSESLYEREKEKGKRQELGMITSSGKRLASLVNSILDFSKLKTHELKLSSKAIDLRTITDTVLHFCRPLVKGKSVELINEIDPSSPLVEADEDRIYQILHNLIGNAIKFTSEGEIIISAIEVQDMVQVCVKDSGIGIPEDKIDDVFKSFEQIDASITREHGGTGLGLTIT